jgi:hypothetical protein
MADFFIDFMENDRLGWIATLHQMLADQRLQNSASGMHTSGRKAFNGSRFLKTGIPV